MNDQTHTMTVRNRRTGRLVLVLQFEGEGSSQAAHDAAHAALRANPGSLEVVVTYKFWGQFSVGGAQ